MSDPFGVPAAWVRRWAHLIPAGGRVLDLAAGGGRHSRFFLGRGHGVVAVDRNVSSLADLQGTAGVEIIETDLEDGGDWDWSTPESFAGIIVTSYLFRPTWPRLVRLLQPSGALIYQTYARGHERFGRPASAHHHLLPAELIAGFGDSLTVVAYEHGVLHQPDAAVQRLAAVKGIELNPL
ncbi:MAG TPA: SAM-dependent methyltransferase [Stellaceae bacterium]|nr:SAM-dependent methyltransferase [Stellaceae bacterium]